MIQKLKGKTKMDKIVGRVLVAIAIAGILGLNGLMWSMNTEMTKIRIATEYLAVGVGENKASIQGITTGIHKVEHRVTILEAWKNNN